MAKPIIQVSGLSKRYRLGKAERYKTLRESLTGVVRGPWDRLRRIAAQPTEEDLFWALRDVSFAVQPGEVVGIIGRNGAGKSTLLKVLSRITDPTEGRIEIHGRVGSLLEVGTGFHPELTGRENVYMNGAILGMRRADIRRRFDEIVAFAEVERFIDTPVKHYSSGMYMRLAFAVAAHLEPEILVIDEVLAVGDVQFQQKCLGKMRDIGEGGRTVLFVSHNMTAVSSLCTRAVCLDAGRVVNNGRVSEVLPDYFGRFAESAAWNGDAGDGTLRLLHTWVRGDSADDILRTDEGIEIGIDFRLLAPVRGLICGFDLYSQHGQQLAHVLFDDDQSTVPEQLGLGTYRATTRIPANTLAAGRYRIVFDVGIWGGRRIINNDGALGFSVERYAGLGMRYADSDAPTASGMFRPNWARTLARHEA